MSVVIDSSPATRRLRSASVVGEVRATPRVSNPLRDDSPVIELDACIDTGAVMLLLGRDVVDKLGVPIIGKAIVTLADESRQEMDKAGPLQLTIGDRTDFFSCLVGPVGCEPLVGQLVLEALDLVVDCGRQALRPRPDSPAYPSYKMK